MTNLCFVQPIASADLFVRLNPQLVNFLDDVACNSAAQRSLRLTFRSDLFKQVAASDRSTELITFVITFRK